jgi:PAS domain-containing protein
MDDPEAKFLDALYRGVVDSAGFKAALELAQGLFNCSGGALVALDAQAPGLDVSVTCGVFDEYGRLYVDQFSKIDPAPGVFARLAAGTASTSDRILSTEQLTADPFVNEFFRPIGLVETLGGNLYSDQARFSLIGLQRGPDRPQFDDAEIAKLERLMPHITRALQLRRTFCRTETMSLGLQAALDRLPAGLALLDGDGAALFVNAAMRGIAQRSDGLTLDRMGLPLPLNIDARRRFEGLLHDVANGGAGGVVTIARASGLRDHVMLVAPAPSSADTLQWENPRRNGAIVLVHDPASEPRSAQDILEQGLHLPKGAARLVAALAGDDDLKSFAERAGVTIHTARFHLHTALARTGAKTQVELVRLAVRLLRDFALAQSHP